MRQRNDDASRYLYFGRGGQVAHGLSAAFRVALAVGAAAHSSCTPTLVVR